MAEKDAIKLKQSLPVTVSSLVDDFRKLGIKANMTLLVHSSLSSLGWVCGGPIAVIKALQAVLTRNGTLVMPTHSGGLSEPSEWQNPPVPEEWWDVIRSQMPSYSKKETRTLGVGIVPETFRSCHEVMRSNHPACSFAAWGKHKDYIASKKAYANSMDDDSPLGRIYELNGKVLLLGASYASNSSFHLAEYRADYPSKKQKDCYAPVRVNGKRQWLCYSDLDLDADDFATIGADMEKCLEIKAGFVAASPAKLIDQRAMVDFATVWMAKNRA